MSVPQVLPAGETPAKRAGCPSTRHASGADGSLAWKMRGNRQRVRLGREQGYLFGIFLPNKYSFA
jgi:hypothetical protein